MSVGKDSFRDLGRRERLEQSILRLGSVLLCTVLVLTGSAVSQSAINEVHIQPRVGESAAEQASSAEAHRSVAMKVLVDLVLVPVTIMDGMNRLVRGLRPDNFELFEGKHQQDIRYFSNEDSPVSLGIILDVSGSMSSKIERAREAVLDFLATSNPDDEFFMITFADKPEQVCDFTQKAEDIQGDLVYAVPKGRTALLDAIYLGISKMRDAKYQRKALLIISDGGDNHSRYTEKEIVSQVKEADVMIYGIGLFDRVFSTQEETLGPELLRKLSEVTGGYAFTIDNPNQLGTVARAVGHMLRNQYLLGYRPVSVKRDGKWHKIKIKFKQPKKVKLYAPRVYAKAGYYAPAE